MERQGKARESQARITEHAGTVTWTRTQAEADLDPAIYLSLWSGRSPLSHNKAGLKAFP